MFRVMMLALCVFISICTGSQAAVRDVGNLIGEELIFSSSNFTKDIFVNNSSNCIQGGITFKDSINLMFGKRSKFKHTFNFSAGRNHMNRSLIGTSEWRWFSNGWERIKAHTSPLRKIAGWSLTTVFNGNGYMWNLASIKIINSALNDEGICSQLTLGRGFLSKCRPNQTGGDYDKQDCRNGSNRIVVFVDENPSAVPIISKPGEETGGTFYRALFAIFCIIVISFALLKRW